MILKSEKNNMSYYHGVLSVAPTNIAFLNVKKKHLGVSLFRPRFEICIIGKRILLGKTGF